MPKSDYYTKPYREWHINYLKKELCALTDAIDVCECFSVSDLVMQEQIAAEVERRGYEIIGSSKLTFIKR